MQRKIGCLARVQRAQKSGFSMRRLLTSLIDVPFGPGAQTGKCMLFSRKPVFIYLRCFLINLPGFAH
jgi:hypothetical protein